MADSARTKRRLTGRASVLAILLLVVVAGTAAFFVSDRPPLSAAFLPVNYARGIGTTSTVSPQVALEPAEALLVKTLAEISNKRMDNALTEIDKVIGAYPNFR
ncbi:MAG TPA: hypothetical protein VK663_07335, partial [Burkholderiales bacterium]|nr:hypothetical protein [Burkholderiales bacterium]